jgi:PAS domain S-box-containing protein
MSLDDAGGDPVCWAHLLEPVEAPVGDATLAQLVRDLADALLVCDPDGTIVFWNEAATALFGWTTDEAVGQSLDLIVPERFRQRHWDGYRQVMATGQTRYGDKTLEVPALHRDGRIISIAFTVTLLTRPQFHGARGIAAVIRDDTQHRQERQAARANQ